MEASAQTSRKIRWISCGLSVLWVWQRMAFWAVKGRAITKRGMMKVGLRRREGKVDMQML